MTDFSPSSVRNASKPAMNDARSKSQNTNQAQIVSGLMMAFLGCKMAHHASNRMQARAGKAKIGGMGR